MTHYKVLLTCLIVGFTLSQIFAQNPGERWEKYDNPAFAGWSPEKLEKARAFADSIGSSAFLLIQDGKIVVNWGDVERRFMCHSVRKSLLSALYGIYADAGEIDIEMTLKELGIDDVHKLTKEEKKAKIIDLLKARSGVYHPAAYETEGMKKIRPERGSHAPNTFWYYNNWDFNTLCAILMQETGKDFFEDFKEKIADPLQMEEFRLMDCYYHLEAEHSQFPAYPFRMSAKDMARIGQLYLQKGKWNGEQLISEKWIEESVTSYSENVRTEGRGYGYMWWTGIYGDEHPNYSAQGVGNQAIIVYPKQQVIMVNRANTYKRERVKTKDLIKLTEMIWDAEYEFMVHKPDAKLLDGGSADIREVWSEKQLQAYSGDFTIDGTPVKVSVQGNQLMIESPSWGKFFMVPHYVDRHAFILEDAGYEIRYQRKSGSIWKEELILER